MRRYLASWLQSLRAELERLEDAEAPKAHVDGVTIIDDYGDDTDELLSLVAKAIAVIRRESPDDHDRLVQHVRTIAIVPLRAGGYYRHRDRRILVNGRVVADGNVHAIALTLIHEITHAHVAAQGIRSRSLAARSREEHICERRVRRFIARMARKYPEWKPFRDARFDQPLRDALDWESYWALRTDDAVEALEHVRAPAAVVRMVRWLGAWRSRAARRVVEREKNEQVADTA